jgi:hypothetical protein
VLICTCTLDKTHGQGCNYMLDVCQWNTVLKVKFLWQVYFLFIVKVMSTILSRLSRSTWAMIMDTVIQVKCWFLFMSVTKISRQSHLKAVLQLIRFYHNKQKIDMVHQDRRVKRALPSIESLSTENCKLTRGKNETTRTNINMHDEALDQS